MTILRTTLNRTEHTCPDTFSSGSSQPVGHRDSGWPERATYRKSKGLQHAVCGQKESFFWHACTIMSKYMQTRKQHPTMLRIHCTLLHYAFKNIDRKIATTHIRGQNSFKNLYLSPSIIKKSIYKNRDVLFQGNRDSQVIKSRRKQMV